MKTLRALADSVGIRVPAPHLQEADGAEPRALVALVRKVESALNPLVKKCGGKLFQQTREHRVDGDVQPGEWVAVFQCSGVNGGAHDDLFGWNVILHYEEDPKKVWFHLFIDADLHRPVRVVDSAPWEKVLKRLTEYVKVAFGGGSETPEKPSTTVVVARLKPRPDLTPSSKGVSYSPNVFGQLSYSEVVGKGLDSGSGAEAAAIGSWLAKHEKNLTPGRHHLDMGAWTDVSLAFKDGKWLVVSSFNYSGG